MLDVIIKFLRDKGEAVLAFILLAAGIWVYFPSFFHIARADHLNYLAETARLSGWYDLAVGTFDLNRTRVFGAGDEVFFRPLLYFFLGNERFFFGYHYFWWQVTGFLVHAAVCFCLWRVLNLIRPGYPALLTAAFFGFLFANLEAVIWHHITAYVVFLVPVFIAMELALRHARRGEFPVPVLAAIASLLTAAAFTYEVGLWYCVCFLVFVGMNTRTVPARRWLRLWFLLPCACYIALSAVNAWLLGSAVGTESGTILKNLGPLKTVQNFLITFKWDVFAGLFLTPADISASARLAVEEKVFAWLWPFNMFKAYHWLGIGLAGAYIAFIARLRRADAGRDRGLVRMLSLMLAGYVMIIVIARVNPLGYALGMLSTLYYLYNFWAVFVVLLYALAARVPEHDRIARILGRALMLFMAVFTIVNAVMIWRQNKWIDYLYKPTQVFVEQLSTVVDQHRQEPDFSFYVRPDHPGNYLGRWFIKGQPDKISSFAEILFPQYYREKDPKYVILGAFTDGVSATLCTRREGGGYDCGSKIP